MENKKFVKIWKNAKVLGDIDKAVATLSIDEIKELTSALELVKVYCGITMRDDCFLNILKFEIKQFDKLGQRSK